MAPSYAGNGSRCRCTQIRRAAFGCKASSPTVRPSTFHSTASSVIGRASGRGAAAALEKHAAAAQAWMGMFGETYFQQQLALSLLTAATRRQHAARTKSAASRIASGLASIHRKAVANAKCLARTRLD